MELFLAQNIVKKFSNHLALDQVNISVKKGSVFGLLGPNGAGKTTLLRIINQITAPDEGNLFLNGQKMKSDDVFHIGYLPEERGLYKKMKVGEQCIYLAQLKGLSKKEAVKNLEYWFRKFEMHDWWNKKVEELSKGMQQKVQFITTVIHNPKLLIFDEPFSGFDPINTNQLKNQILELRDNGATIIFSTHNMGSVEEICDDISLINKSKNLISGSVSEIKNNYKSGVYKICFYSNEENLVNSLNSEFKILSQKRNDDNITTVEIKIKDGISQNEFISKLIPHAKIISFNEVIPSMNDVFINVVESQNLNSGN